MNMPYTSIEAYIHSFPDEIQAILQELRRTIQEVVPEATEKISYGIPTFYLKGNLVHFAAYKKHIGFYPGATGIEVFQQDLSGYKSSKGAVQFPLEAPLPLKLIRKIVKYRKKENLAKANKAAKH